MKDFMISFILEFLISLVLFFLLSILMSITSISESIIIPFTIAITIFSIFVGSFNYSKKIKKNGIICGGLLSISYFIILYLISSILHNNFGLSFLSLILIFSGLFVGITGGILGVNFDNN